PAAAPAPAGSAAAARPLARLAVAGDTGTGSDQERAVAAEMARRGGDDPYAALVLLGDLVYDVGDPALVDRVVTRPYAPVLGTGAVLVPVLGNHDEVSGEQGRILRALGRDHPWYVQQVGPVRLVVLDSNRVDDPAQTRWLEQTLAADVPAGTWTLVAMHHPAYSAGVHGSDARVRAAWAPLFARHHVPLVLAGHDHDYERTAPQDGVTYVVSGGGAKTRPVGREPFTAVSAARLHYLDLAVYADRLVGTAITPDGQVLDRFTLTR
ncbi:metallophosphoesterase family protein, partial [Georgenia thermotolerans]